MLQNKVVTLRVKSLCSVVHSLIEWSAPEHVATLQPQQIEDEPPLRASSQGCDNICVIYMHEVGRNRKWVLSISFDALIHQRAKSLSLWIWPEKRKSISAHNSSTSLLALISYYTVKKKENVEQHKIKSMLFLAFTIKKRLNHQLKWSHFSACMRQRELTGPQSTATEYSVI